MENTCWNEFLVIKQIYSQQSSTLNCIPIKQDFILATVSIKMFTSSNMSKELDKSHRYNSDCSHPKGRVPPAQLTQGERQGTPSTCLQSIAGLIQTNKIIFSPIIIM